MASAGSEDVEPAGAVVSAALGEGDTTGAAAADRIEENFQTIPPTAARITKAKMPL